MVMEAAKAQDLCLASLEPQVQVWKAREKSWLRPAHMGRAVCSLSLMTLSDELTQSPPCGDSQDSVGPRV